MSKLNTIIPSSDEIKNLEVGKCQNLSTKNLNSLLSTAKVKFFSLKEDSFQSKINLTNCTHLEGLALLSCTQLTYISGISECTNLKWLEIKNCPKLDTALIFNTTLVNLFSELPTSLKHLDISGCQSIKINHFEQNSNKFKNLSELKIIGCHDLERSIPALTKFLPANCKIVTAEERPI